MIEKKKKSKTKSFYYSKLPIKLPYKVYEGACMNVLLADFLGNSLKVPALLIAINF